MEDDLDAMLGVCAYVCVCVCVAIMSSLCVCVFVRKFGLKFAVGAMVLCELLVQST